MTYSTIPHPSHKLSALKDLLMLILWVVHIYGEWCEGQVYGVLDHLPRDQQ